MPRTVRELRLGALLAAALFATACPYSNSPFEGVWTVTDGSTTLVCDGGTTVKPASGSVVVIDEHGAIAVAIEGNTESFALTGSTANTYAEEIPLTDDAGFQDGWTLSLIGDALSLSGNALFESATGTEETFDAGQVCGFSRWLEGQRP